MGDIILYYLVKTKDDKYKVVADYLIRWWQKEQIIEGPDRYRTIHQLKKDYEKDMH